MPDKQYDNLGKILASAEHLLSLINSVLDLSKIEAGRIEVRPTEFALEPVVDQCLRTVEPMVKGELRLEKQIQPDLPTLFTDQEKLRRPYGVRHRRRGELLGVHRRADPLVSR